MPFGMWIPGDFQKYIQIKFSLVQDRRHRGRVFRNAKKFLQGKPFKTYRTEIDEHGIEMAEENKTATPGELNYQATRIGVIWPYRLKIMSELHPNIMEKNIGVLKSIIEKLAKNNIQLVMYTTPYYYQYHEKFSLQISSEMKKSAQKLSIDFDVPFIDLSQAPEIAYNASYFVDVTHLNPKGSIAFTKEFLLDLQKCCYFKLGLNRSWK